MNKTDYAIAAFVGFFGGIFAIPTAYNLGLRDPYVLLALPWVGALLWAAGIWLGNILARRVAFLAQFSKFVAVGFLNTAIDFGVLNLLSRLSGVTAGLIIGGVNLPGFLVAIFNSYLWNKLWVFGDRGSGPLFRDFPKFFAVTGIGVLLNSGIVILLTTYVPPLLGMSAEVWLNASKVAATLITLFWNFAGYKFVVFRTMP